MRPIPALFAALLVGCFEKVDNPTGDCRPADDGGRACVHAPARGDTYLPDCQAPLEREYWRVFAQSSTSAYILPRPDAAGLTYGICDGDDAALAALFDRNGLCEETADPRVLNDMTPADALAVTRALHQRLVFEAVDAGDGAWAILPAPFPDDLAAACELPVADVGAAQSACAVYGSRIQGDTCLDIGHVPSAEDAPILADALNQLYGVAP